MYDIRQFKPALYVLLVMGMTGFALAAQSPVVWLGAVAALCLNAWLVKTDRFRPIPRLIANIATVAATLISFLSFNRSGNSAILVIGQFLVFMQIVKIFEQRGNRDYAQLLVLSLLLMVAASINTASLLFGILLVAYLFLSLYCCLLFHLKVETDHARSAIGLPEESQNPMTLRQDQRYLSRSMRRLTALVSIASVSMAVLVFLFFPRMTGAGLLGPLSAKPSQTLVGFNDHVGFQNIAQIGQNTEVVAYAKVWRGSSPIEGTEPLLLRGLTLDIYTGNDPGSAAWQWTRMPARETPNEVDKDQPRTIQLDETDPAEPLRQQITLLPTGSNCLFALPGVTSITPGSGMEGKLRYRSRDQSIQTDPPVEKQVKYDVLSSGKLKGTPITPEERAAMAASSAEDIEGRRRRNETQLVRSVIDPQIESFARRPEVSGTDSAGPLATLRDKAALVTKFDERIAGNIEKYLRSDGGFAYTLDLTDAKRVGNRDPMVAFLYDLKRGHCEYFAGAMSLMCQSLGLQSRVVVGFKVDGADFNSMTHSYIVRQSHAHAWVEVLNDQGEWLTFDPTTGREAPANAAMTAWKRVKQFFDYLDYTWANSVVAYDQKSRSSLIQNVENNLNDRATTSGDQLHAAQTWLSNLFSQQNYFIFSSKVLAIVISLLVIGLICAVLWFVLERWRIRRRARRIGLDALPLDAQLRMARKLGFYDDLMRLLARHNITCPASLTPLEFSRSISFLPNELFDAVYRVTEIFYQVRFGRVSLSNAQQKHLSNVITKVDQGLSNFQLKRSKPL